jgi:hypothetical protein
MLLTVYPAQDFILSLYNRRLMSVEDLVHPHRLHITSVSTITPTITLALECLRRAIRLYLQGAGHPPEFVHAGVVSQQAATEASKDPLFRCNLFLKAMTDSELLPSDAFWYIKVYTQIIWYYKILISTHLITVDIRRFLELQ